MRSSKQLEALRAATQVLESSDSFWFAIVESSLDGIIVSDRDGIIVYANPVAHTIFGYRGDEITGLDVGILAGGEHKDKHPEYIHRYRETGVKHIIGRLNRHVKATTKDGSGIDIILSISEVKNGAHYFVAHVRLNDDESK